jgi:hypothetical protein
MTGIGSDTGVNKGVGRGGRKGDRRGDLLHGLDLVLQRRGVGRPAGERGAVRRSRVDRVQIFISQKVGAELQVIIKIKGATGFESGPEGRHRWGFRKFPHALDTTELTLGILLGHFGATTGTAMVVVGMHLGGMLRVLVMMLLLVVVGVQEGRHDG